MERVVARLIRLEVSRSIASQALEATRNVHPFRSGPRASIAQLVELVTLNRPTKRSTLSSCNPIGYDAGHTCGMRQLLLPSPSSNPLFVVFFFSTTTTTTTMTLRPVRWNRLHPNLFINYLFEIVNKWNFGR